MIINNRDKKLLPLLKSNIAWADEVVICVAFFKSSGLNEILEEIKKSKDFTLVESRLTIDNYNVKYSKYRKIVQPAIQEAKKVTKNIHYFKVGNLLQYARANSEKIKVDFRVKNNDYDKAKNQLNHVLATNYEDKEAFLKDYQIVINCFRSSGLNRGKTIFSNDFQKIIQIIRLAKTINKRNQKEALAKARNLLKEINKFGINALTEILNTYHPQLFPVLNGRTMSVLSNLGIIKHKDPNSFNTDNYLEYRKVLTEIKRLGKFQDFRETDLVFSHYYEDIVKKP